MQKITTHLWFDKEAKEAAEFYVSTFGKGSKVTNLSKLDNTPSGSVDIVTFELLGREFQAISAGPFFKFNPSVSFHVALLQTSVNGGKNGACPNEKAVTSDLLRLHTT